VARDLIPPPSPAGRPSPDAMRHTSRRADAQLEEAAAPETPPPAGPSPFRSRFGFVLGALVGIATAAVVLFVALLGSSPRRSTRAAADRWSTWNPPSGDIFTGPEAIADHVQTQYKRADGKQLVIVHGGPFYVSGSPPVPFIVRLQPADGSIRDLSTTGGVLYTLAGTGDNGMIVGDKATPARHRLLRREALELALYTFRYVQNASSFVALLPRETPAAKPKAGDTKKTEQLQAVFFQPRDLKDQLHTPLTRTLKPATKLNPRQLTGEEAKRVDTLTKRSVYTAKFQQPSDGQLYLVLTRSG
jgi:hypothetical protein